MRVQDVMSTDVVVASPRTSVDEAVHLLADRRITSLPVVDNEGRVVGILSEADLLAHLLARDPRAHQIPVVPEAETPPGVVGDLMTVSPHVTRPDEDVSDLAAVMARHGWKSVPVVSAGRIVGIVSRSDVLRALARPETAIAHEAQAVLTELGHPEWQVSVYEGLASVVGPATPTERAAAQAALLSVTGVRRVHIDRPPTG